MTKRKFTPPTEFPAAYVDGYGGKVVLYAKGHGNYPLIGQHQNFSAVQYSEAGELNFNDSLRDLHDIPKRITTWHNVYPDGPSFARKRIEEEATLSSNPRICVYRIERDEDGGNPEIFVEEV